MNNKIIISAVLTLFLSIPQIASAHFHYGLSLTTHLQANAQQKLSAIQMTWTYNNEVSELMLKDQNDTEKLGKALMKDLEQLNYFTTLKLNNQVLETDLVKSYKLESIIHQEQTKLKLSLTLPLKKPVSLQGANTLEINHEDAAGSAIIYHVNTKAISIDQSLNKKCDVDLKEKQQDVEEGVSPQQLKIICHA